VGDPPGPFSSPGEADGPAGGPFSDDATPGDSLTESAPTEAAWPGRITVEFQPTVTFSPPSPSSKTNITFPETS
jgi:hypothetical protein